MYGVCSGCSVSSEQSPQPARWIGVFVVVARILDYMCGSAVLDFGKGREVHHRMLGEACGVAYIRRFLASNDCEACGVAYIRRFLTSNDWEACGVMAMGRSLWSGIHPKIPGVE